MSTKNKRKYNLKASLLLLLLTAILLIATSYAWFTSNQTVAIQSLQVNVEAKNGLQISADGTNWKTIIQTSDLQGVKASTYTSAVNQIPDKMEPVSTSGNVDTGTGFLDMFYGVVGSKADGSPILSATKETEANGSSGKFISFDLFFKTPSGMDIDLSTDSGVRFADTSSKGMENAARVAFLIEGNTTEGDSIANIQGLKGATNSARFIWEPNYDTHTATAVAHARDTYGITTTQTGGSLLPYDGVKAEITTDLEVPLAATSTTHSAYLEAAPIAYSTVNGFSTNQPIFSLQPGITKVRIYMWIEGQDVDCENNASGSNIKYDLKITQHGATP